MEESAAESEVPEPGKGAEHPDQQTPEQQVIDQTITVQNNIDQQDSAQPQTDDQPNGPFLNVSTVPKETVLHIVGIGASAGGLEALEMLLGSLPADARPAFVVAQHLSPDHRSLLADLMDRRTPLPVRLAVDGAPLLPGTVSIAPRTATSALIASGWW